MRGSKLAGFRVPAGNLESMLKTFRMNHHPILLYPFKYRGCLMGQAFAFAAIDMKDLVSP